MIDASMSALPSQGLLSGVFHSVDHIPYDVLKAFVHYGMYPKNHEFV